MSERHEARVDDTIRSILDESAAGKLYDNCIREPGLNRGSRPYDQDSEESPEVINGPKPRPSLSSTIGTIVIRGAEAFSRACSNIAYPMNSTLPYFRHMEISPKSAKAVGRATISIGIFAINQYIQATTGYNPILDSGAIIFNGHQ